MAIDSRTGQFDSNSDYRKYCYEGLLPLEGTFGAECPFTLPTGTTTRFRLEGKPARTYSLIVYFENDRLDHRPSLVRFMRKPLNMRWHTIAWTLAVVAGGLGLTLLLYRFRPGAGVLPQWLDGHPWSAVPFVSGCGAMISAVVYFTLPPDIGGTDKFKPMMLLPLPLYFLAGAVVGYCLSLFRQRIAEVGYVQRVLYASVAGIISGILLVMLQGNMSRMFESVPSMDLKRCYYMYFALSIILPLILVRAPSWQRGDELTAGAIPPTRSRAVRVFQFSMIGGLVAGLLAILVGIALKPLNSDPFIPGFYKPVAAFGYLLSAAPVLFAFAMAVNLGEERPTWIQRADWWLDKLMHIGQKRQQLDLARDILAALRRHRPFSRNDRRHLCYIAFNYQARIAPIVRTRKDLEILADAMSVSADTLESEVDAIASSLAEIEPTCERRSASAILMLDDEGRGIRSEITIIARRELRREGRDFAVEINGFPLERSEKHYDHVRSVAENVLETLVRPQGLTGRRPLERCRIYVRMGDVRLVREDRPEAGIPITGVSYQLPMVLTLYGLAACRTPAFEFWAATGKVLPTLEVTGVGGVRAKAAAMGEDPFLFLCPVENIEELDGQVPVTTVLNDETGLESVRTEVREALRGSRAITVGVGQVQLAIRLVFGE